MASGSYSDQGLGPTKDDESCSWISLQKKNALRTGASRPVGALVSVDRFGSLPHGARRGIRKIPALQFLLAAPAHLLVAHL